MQGFVKRPAEVAKGLDFDRKLYVARRVFEQSNDDTYVVSLSSRTIVYKGMFLVEQLRLFFADLQDKDYESAIATVHSRFSTNTNPSWERAHPNRFIVHNGEINTIKGNADKMLAREETMESEHLKGELQKVLPVINSEGSDSAMLDNTLEFLVMSGMELPLAVMIMIPEPWANNRIMSQKKKDFYQYYATMMEPWDGPAALLFSDGRYAGGMLDRNGLRPARYLITQGGMMVVASEVGVMDFEPGDIKEKGRLQPGKILLIDTEKGEIYYDGELKKQLAEAKPYRTWLAGNRIELDELKSGRKVSHSVENYDSMLRIFGYSKEDVERLIVPMCTTGAEPINSMGNDTPLAVLSDKPQLLYNYFRQQFAQVTNPPIDPIREELVMSLTEYIGAVGMNILTPSENHCKMVRLNHPHPEQRPTGYSLQHPVQRLQDRETAPALRSGKRVPGIAGSIGNPLQAGGRIRQRRSELHRAFRPRRRRRPCRHSVTACRVGGTPPSYLRGQTGADGTDCRKRRNPRSDARRTAAGLRSQRTESVYGFCRHRQTGERKGNTARLRHCRKEIYQVRLQRLVQDYEQDGHQHHPFLPGRENFRGRRTERGVEQCLLWRTEFTHRRHTPG